MSSLLASSKLSGAIKLGLLFHRTRSTTKLTGCAFPATQTSFFRSATQQQGQAGLARAPEPEYIPEHIIQDLPRSVTRPPFFSETSFQDVQDSVKKDSAATLQDTTNPVTQTTSTEPVLDTTTVPAYHRGSKFDRVPYWQKIGRWKDITAEKFLSYRWGVSQTYSPHQSRSIC